MPRVIQPRSCRAVGRRGCRSERPSGVSLFVSQSVGVVPVDSRADRAGLLTRLDSRVWWWLAMADCAFGKRRSKTATRAQLRDKTTTANAQELTQAIARQPAKRRKGRRERRGWEKTLGWKDDDGGCRRCRSLSGKASPLSGWMWAKVWRWRCREVRPGLLFLSYILRTSHATYDEPNYTRMVHGNE